MKLRKQIIFRINDSSSIKLQLFQRENQRFVQLKVLGETFSIECPEQVFLEEFLPSLHKLAIACRLFSLIDGIANRDWTFWYDELVLQAKQHGITEDEVKHWLSTSNEFYITKYGLCCPFGSKKSHQETAPILAYLPFQKGVNDENKS